MNNQLTEKQEQWLRALESGEYQQCTGRLYKGDSYCCLGVLEIVVLGHKPIQLVAHTTCTWAVENNGPDGEAGTVSNNYRDICLYNKQGGIQSQYQHLFREKLAVLGYIDNAPDDVSTISLTTYNDHGATFKQLAAAIRAYPQAVFSNFDETTNEAQG